MSSKPCRADDAGERICPVLRVIGVLHDAPQLVERENIIFPCVSLLEKSVQAR